MYDSGNDNKSDPKMIEFHNKDQKSCLYSSILSVLCSDTEDHWSPLWQLKMPPLVCPSFKVDPITIDIFLLPNCLMWNYKEESYSVSLPQEQLFSCCDEGFFARGEICVSHWWLSEEWRIVYHLSWRKKGWKLWYQCICIGKCIRLNNISTPKMFDDLQRDVACFS